LPGLWARQDQYSEVRAQGPEAERDLAARASPVAEGACGTLQSPLADLACQAASIDAEAATPEARGDGERRARAAHRIQHEAVGRAGRAHDALEQCLGLLRRIARRLQRERGVRAHRGAVAPDAAQAAAGVGVVAIRLAADDAFAIAPAL